MSVKDFCQVASPPPAPQNVDIIHAICQQSCRCPEVLSRLARVSKAFSEPALRILWRNMQSTTSGFPHLLRRSLLL
ncbi:hypothetical protein OBBRIDRAFT_355824 [Obba rivulosa]|uniref:Uncharacterized protein n=1 Tax=Obba rivulosa TaxID=1052685 RepID=A0A8E2AI51_9APHY|nr:hypothetical protein OBBRIDRAFT_355824 [Obba rivulosa]